MERVSEIGAGIFGKDSSGLRCLGQSIMDAGHYLLGAGLLGWVVSRRPFSMRCPSVFGKGAGLHIGRVAGYHTTILGTSRHSTETIDEGQWK